MGNVLNRETMGPNTKKIHNWVSWALTGIFFIVVIAYAGWRGYNAYLNVPAVTSRWQPSASIPFPVIDFCPLVPVPIVAKECELEFADTAVSSCLSSVTQTTITIETKIHNCLTFNSQGTLTSSSTIDEIGIQVYINSSLLPADDPVMGCFVSIHEYGVAPELEVDSSFIADVAKLTEVYLGLTKLVHLDGTTEMDYYSTASGAQNRDPTLKDTMDVDFWFNPPGGYTVATQYIPYTVNNWIGEVGGFTCLLTFLHTAVLWIFMAIYRKVRDEPVSIQMSKNEDKF